MNKTAKNTKDAKDSLVISVFLGDLATWRFNLLGAISFFQQNT
jgi:hypothetical protein